MRFGAYLPAQSPHFSSQLPFCIITAAFSQVDGCQMCSDCTDLDVRLVWANECWRIAHGLTMQPAHTGGGGSVREGGHNSQQGRPANGRNGSRWDARCESCTLSLSSSTGMTVSPHTSHCLLQWLSPRWIHTAHIRAFRSKSLGNNDKSGLGFQGKWLFGLLSPFHGQHCLLACISA